MGCADVQYGLGPLAGLAPCGAPTRGRPMWGSYAGLSYVGPLSWSSHVGPLCGVIGAWAGVGEVAPLRAKGVSHGGRVGVWCGVLSEGRPCLHRAGGTFLHDGKAIPRSGDSFPSPGVSRSLPTDRRTRAELSSTTSTLCVRVRSSEDFSFETCSRHKVTAPSRSAHR